MAVDTSFMDDVIFPIHISWGSVGGPDWPGEIAKLASGAEERNTNISTPLRLYDAKYGVRDHDELHEILTIYLAALGMMRGFRMLDWRDYRSGSPLVAPTALDQVLGTGDGVQTIFQMVNRYQVGVNTHDRKITRPFGTTLIAVDATPIGSGFSVDNTTGLVTFTVAPAIGEALTWGGQFHVPVRFDSKLDQTAIFGPLGDIPSIFLQELQE